MKCIIKNLKPRQVVVELSKKPTPEQVIPISPKRVVTRNLNEEQYNYIAKKYKGLVRITKNA